jgi:dTDP-3-amino-3,4,6-trideoxy-alpha-D-glucose transaminase
LIPFNDLAAQHAPIQVALNEALQRVANSGWYVLGEELRAFEPAFADYLGAPHCIGCASGTDAIQLALQGFEIGPGDEVITAANTCVPTVAGIVAAGATPVLADVDPDTLTLAAESVKTRMSDATKGIVAVHLYGHPCDMDALRIDHGVKLIEDCAQAHGSRYRGNGCGTLGDAAAFSFYPTKNLGAMGDGGAVVTNDAAAAERVRALRHYGRTHGYEHPWRGGNSRLDEIQAAVLRVKLEHLDTWNAMRRTIANRYRASIANEYVHLIKQADYADSNEHLFVIRSNRRDALMHHLQSHGVATQIHYPAPIHFAEAYHDLGAPGAFPVAERACEEVMSLPLYPGMPDAHVDAVIEATNTFKP